MSHPQTPILLLIAKHTPALSPLVSLIDSQRAGQSLRLQEILAQRVAMSSGSKLTSQL